MRSVIYIGDPLARLKPCLRCQTSLREVKDVTHCPTCGLSIWLSLNQNDSLDGSNPAWLGRVTLAALALAVSQIVGLVAYLLIESGNYLQLEALRITGPWIGALYLLLFSIGMLLLAQPEHRHPDRLRLHRLAIRIAAGLTFLMAAIVITIPLIFGYDLAPAEDWHLHPPPAAKPHPAPRNAPGYNVAAVSDFTAESDMPDDMEAAGQGPPARSTLPTDASRFVFQMALVISALPTLIYLRRLARRGYHPRAARWCGIIMLAPALVLLRIPFFACFAALAFLVPLLSLLPLFYLPASLILFFWFSRTFRKAATAATEHWAKETASPA